MPDDDPPHLPARALRDYRQNRTSPAQTLAVSDHLAVCGECRRALTEIDDGPGYDALAAAADGTLAPEPRAALAARLADAPAAAAELADLESFRREMQGQAGRVYGPQTGQEPSPPQAGKIVAPPMAAWRGPGRWLAAVAAALALLAAGWWTLGRSPDPSEASRLLTDRQGRRADLADLPANVRDAVAHLLGHGQLEASPALAALRPPAGTLAGPAGGTLEFRPVSPAGVVTRDARPVLRWTSRTDATGYVVTLVEADSGRALSSGELPASQTAWTASPALVPGAVYSWQVEALRGADILDRTPKPPAAEARFQVLGTSQSDELRRVEARFGGFPLIMAVAFVRAGVMGEAASQLDTLALEHPQSPLARRLREEIVGRVKFRPRPARTEPSKTDAASPASPRG